MLLLIGLVNTTPVQNFLARKTTSWLSQKLKTKVAISHVRIDFLNHVSLQGLYIEDRAHDTLLYAGEATVRITDWFMFRDKPTLHYLGLKNTYIHMYRTAISGDWSSDFIADAFASKSPAKKDTGKSIELDLKQIALENVRFHYDDAWGGEDLDFDIGKLDIDAKGIDYKKKLIDVKNIDIKGAIVGAREYTAGRPHHAIVDTIDTTPFNTGNWAIKVGNIKLDACQFNLTMNDKTPLDSVFDENHLIIKNISARVNTASIIGDTIHGTVTQLFARDRCGLAIRNMRSKISVSPVACICSNLTLETNYSKIGNYYAMRYKRFPDFLDYINKVVMEGNLHDATVDSRDIAYFAPILNDYPAVVQVSGHGKGTVAKLEGDHLVVTNGSTVVKGNVTLKGLPDIYTTYITYSNGEIYTTGNGILKYATSMRNSPNLALEELTHAYFKGSYEGYIENFNVKGQFVTNLGSVSTDIKMTMPGFNTNEAVYSGIIATGDLQLGRLIRQPLVGNITCQENVTGRSFDPDNAQLNVDGTVRELGINNYAYKNLTTHGTLTKKQFNGTLLVDDPNLALEFDGGLDYREKDVKINATAHLLFSNLKALNLTKDSVTTSADFDLNCSGSNIDNFSGFARLYNIDLKRNSHKVAVDSINMSSVINDVDGTKALTIQSNDVTASIKGEYQLSKLPVSVQYYLSKYIPNYISVPKSLPPPQNFSFKVITRNIDSILAISFASAKGFDTSTVSGSLNTYDQKVTLSVSVPSGSIGIFHMTNITINALGTLDQVGLTANIDNVAVGDSVFNSTLSVTTTLANDSLNFTVATTAPDTGSSITLNGEIVARKDSLFLNLHPSEFYLNRNKWDIAGGSTVAYSDHYLDVENINLTSGLQKITANTHLANNDQSLVINTENLDLAQFGAMAGLAPYQPDGRLNGTITIEKIFQQFYVSANMKATGVKLGSDTVGTINLIGFYDGARKLVNLDPQTGIYRDNASIVASGNISFDSTTNQKLDGSIQFNNAPVEWASPFLIGIFSHLTGVVNGNIGFTGSSYDPVISGSLGLVNGGLRVDYMGTNYNIPSATVSVTNKRISWGMVDVLDEYKNHATLTGHFSHNLFRDMHMHINLRSRKFEVMKLTANDNNIFYGDLIASMDSFTVRGPFNNIKLHAYNAAPAAKSHIYIPVSSGGDINTYSYVSFKTYGKTQEKPTRHTRDKMQINVDANFNELAEMTIVMDPATNDQINTTGEGNIQLEIPPGNDMSIIGDYLIKSGTYNFTLKQLEYRRDFKLISGSAIKFRGGFFSTQLDVDAKYSVTTRLYDLLDDNEKRLSLSPSELADAQAPQQVDVLLHMKGTLKNPQLTFDLDLPEKHSIGTYAYTKLTRINQDDRQKFDQVGSLLLINSFIPPDGLTSSSAAGTVAINNISQVLSSTASTGLTNIVKKLVGDQQLNVDVKYNNYNVNNYDATTNATAIAANRSQVKLNVSRNFFDDRLSVQLGSTSDWGRPASASSTTNFNITGDFRIQYALAKSSNLRLNAFRTSDYDVTLDKNISRAGVGLSWRKSFDNLGDFFHGFRYSEMKKKEELEQKQAADTTQKPGTNN